MCGDECRASRVAKDHCPSVYGCMHVHVHMSTCVDGRRAPRVTRYHCACMHVCVHICMHVLYVCGRIQGVKGCEEPLCIYARMYMCVLCMPLCRYVLTVARDQYV